MPDGRLLVFLYARICDATGKSIGENRLVEIRADGTLGRLVAVPLKHPLETFFSASARAGCAPSDTLDLLGEAGRTIRYAKVRIAS